MMRGGMQRRGYALRHPIWGSKTEVRSALDRTCGRTRVFWAFSLPLTLPRCARRVLCGRSRNPVNAIRGTVHSFTAASFIAASFIAASFTQAAAQFTATPRHPHTFQHCEAHPVRIAAATLRHPLHCFIAIRRRTAPEETDESQYSRRHCARRQ